MLVLEVIVPDGSGPAGRIPVRSEPSYVGRLAGNDVVVPSPAVSGRHLAVWCVGDRVWVEDLRSRNGTTVGDQPVRGRVQVGPGDEIVLAKTVVLRVHRIEGSERGALTRLWWLEDVASGLRFPVRSDRFRVGASPESDLIVADGPEMLLVLSHEGALLQGEDDGSERPLMDGELLTVGASTFRVGSADSGASATMDVAEVWYPYTVAADLDAPGGPTAVVVDTVRGHQHTVTAANRAVLLFVLARKAQADSARGLSRPLRGWCDDEDVARGVWGRSGPERQLKVLVCRLRAELREAGFDAWFLEKRRGAIRLRLQSAA